MMCPTYHRGRFHRGTPLLLDQKRCILGEHGGLKADRSFKDITEVNGGVENLCFQGCGAEVGWASLKPV